MGFEFLNDIDTKKINVKTESATCNVLLFFSSLSSRRSQETIIISTINRHLYHVHLLFSLLVMTIKCDGTEHLWCFIHSGHCTSSMFNSSAVGLIIFEKQLVTWTLRLSRNIFKSECKKNIHLQLLLSWFITSESKLTLFTYSMPIPGLIVSD